ncbi:hypothetical protein [Oceanospirillum sediminis]|uniref:Uncharacterized protein n=1 Tax=Oceanospirillum sediminis TaxID=2760088 RepID=A0A839IR80_9GAMM|nr:hypothetical protein [Oceanospirillum sediminis]MBB1487174.1 hypothetical protein [Oceanospirillum sediminis]
MYAQVEKPEENKSRVFANPVAQKKSNGGQGVRFVDNRTKNGEAANSQIKCSSNCSTKQNNSTVQMMWDYNTLIAMATTIGIGVYTIYYLVNKYGFKKTSETIQAVKNRSGEGDDDQSQVFTLLGEENKGEKRVEGKREEDLGDAKESEETFTGLIDYDTAFFVSHEGKKLKIKNETGVNFNRGTKVNYQLYEHPNMKELFFARLVSAGNLLPDDGAQQKRIDALSNRKTEVAKLNLVKKIELIGKLNALGARKHYSDRKAIARNDRDLNALIRQRLGLHDFSITKINATSDEFSIPLGGLMSVVGEIEYSDNLKTSVNKIKVWHAGPSM